MQNSNFFSNVELQEVDDADDTVYEYGLPSEEEAGLIGAVRNLYAPQRREVIKAPEEKQVPLEELGMDAVPGETMTVKTPGEYGPVETDFSYAPIVRGAKSVLDYGKKLFSDKQTQEDTVEALKAAPAAAVEGGDKFLEDQMAAAMGMSAGYSSVNRPDGEVARFDPLAFTGAVAPAGIAAVSSAKAGETVLGIFGSTMGKGSRKRFDKFTEEAEKADDLEFDTPEAREEYLFQKSKGVFVDEAGDPRFEIATKDVDLLPYFKRRNLVEGTSDSYEITPDPTMRSETVLADVLKFDELFKEYPALKNYIVEPLSEEDILDGTTGTFSPSTTTLRVAPQKRKEFLSTLLHEVQHAVDDLEGLQSGSSPNVFTTFSSEHLGAERRNFFYFLTNKETSDSFDKYTPDELEILKSKEHKKLMPLAFSGLDFTKPMYELRDLYRPIIAKMADWEKENFDKLVQLQKESVLDSDEAYRKYRGTPGEVDARNVEKRFLNPELQLTSLPKNTSDTDKLFGLTNKRGDKVSSVSKSTDTITSRQVGDTEYDAIFKNLDELETPEEWQAAAKKLVTEERDITGRSVVRRTPALEQSARDLIDNKLITREQHLENIANNKPITEWTDLPRQPSSKAMTFALKPSQREQGLFLLSKQEADSLNVKQTSLKDGDLFNGRLDIPAYQNYDTWVVAGTSPAVKTADGKGITTYAKAIHYTSGKGKPVRFIASEKRSQEIGTGREGKTGYATISGKYKATSEEDLRNLAEKYLSDPEWSQVGFDPRRLGTFYLRKGTDKYNVGSVVTEADEVIQIGPLVLAKNVKIDPSYEGYNKGGLMARR